MAESEMDKFFGGHLYYEYDLNKRLIRREVQPEIKYLYQGGQRKICDPFYRKYDSYFTNDYKIKLI